MAEGRFVSRSIATNEQLAGVSFLADYLFVRCVPHLDVEGRMTGNPTLIKAKVAPLRPEMTVDKIPELIQELARALDRHGEPLLVWYAVADMRVLHFPGFSRQQKGLRRDRESPSKLPSPTEATEIVAGPPHYCRPTPEFGRSGAGAAPAEGEVEGEDQVQLEEEPASSPPRAPLVGTADSRTITRRQLAAVYPRLLSMLPERPDRDVIVELAMTVPDWRAYLAECDAALDGQHGAALSGDEIATAITDWLANGEEPNRRKFRNYLLGARRLPNRSAPRTRATVAAQQYANALGGHS